MENIIWMSRNVSKVEKKAKNGKSHQQQARYSRDFALGN